MPRKYKCLKKNRGDNRAARPCSSGITKTSDFLDCRNVGVPLQNERNQRPHALPVVRVLIAELLQHEPFFNLQFEPQSKATDKSSNEAADVSEDDGRAQHAHQQPGVDGMAYKSVGAAQDEFVVLLDGDSPAPVSAEDGACPDAEEHAGHCNRCTEQGPERYRRNEPRSEPATFENIPKIKNEQHANE